MNSVQREAVIKEVLSWVNTPYHHMGRIKGVAVDCGMLLLEVYEAAGLIPHVEVESYPHDWHMHRSRPRYMEKVLEYAHPVAEPLPGDIAVFKYGRCISHGAIVLAWPKIIHAYVGLGVVEDDCATNLDLGNRLAGFYSLRGG